MRDPTLAAFSCACGSADVFAVRPGLEVVRRGAVDLFSRLDPVVEGRVDVCWCLACWSKRWGRNVA